MISVVVPLYNKAVSVREAIDSVLAQSFTQWEMIVVDDGSRDDGASVVTSYQDARIVLVQQANAGVAAARNTGVARASGELVALLDADDHWHPDHLATLAALAERYPDATLYGTPSAFIGANGVQHLNAIDAWRVTAPQGFSIIEDLGSESVLFDLPFNTSSVMVRRSALLALGGFPVGVTTGEDWLIWLKLSCAGQVAYSARPTAYYNEPSVVQSQARPQQTPDVVGAGLRQLMREHPAHAVGLRRFLALWHRMRAVSFMELNERRACVRDLIQAVKLDKVTSKDLICFGMLGLPKGLRARLLTAKRLAKRAKRRV